MYHYVLFLFLLSYHGWHQSTLALLQPSSLIRNNAHQILQQHVPNYEFDNKRITRNPISSTKITSRFSHRDNLADDEPLSSRFKRAVVLQRAGEHMEALKEYEIFINAAKQCDVSPSKYAEVLVNVGAIYTKLQQKDNAIHYFESALEYRDIGSAHVNLALLTLSKGQMSVDNVVRRNALLKAKEHCQKAIALNDDVYSVNSATKLMKDIEKLLQ